MEKIKNFQHAIINILLWLFLTITFFILSPGYKVLGIANTLVSISVASILFLVLYASTGIFFDIVIRILLKNKLYKFANILKILFILIPIIFTLYVINIFTALVKWR